MVFPEPVFVNVDGAKFSIPRNRFGPPLRPGGPVLQIGLSYRPARLGIDSWAPWKVYKYGLRFLAIEGLWRTGLHWSLSTKSSFDHPAFEISCLWLSAQLFMVRLSCPWLSVQLFMAVGSAVHGYRFCCLWLTAQLSMAVGSAVHGCRLSCSWLSAQLFIAICSAVHGYRFCCSRLSV